MKYIVYCLLSILGTTVFAQSELEKLAKTTQDGQYAQAIEDAKVYLQTHPNDGDAQFLLAKAYALSHQENKSIPLLVRLIQKNPTYQDGRILLIRLYFQNHEYGLAHQVIQQGLDLSPDNPQLLEWRSIILSQVSNAPPAMNLKDLYQKGMKTIAIQKAQDYLKVYTNDADMALLLARFYIQEGDYEKARTLLIPYITMYPSYTDIYVQLVNIDIVLNRLKEAKKFVNLGLLYAPWDTQLHKKQQDIALLERDSKKKFHYAKDDQQEDSASRKTSIPTVAPIRYQNEVGFNQQNYYITDRRKVWDYTSVFYGHQTKFGKLYGKINYANRLKREAVQFEMEYFPKINDYIYLDLDASTANQPVLFPNYAYAGEVFVVLPNLFNPSFGAQMNRINNRYQFTRFTTSISKDIDISNLTFRPYFYLPNRGASSILYTLNYRYMFNEPYGYMGFILGTGTTPDLANLETVDFLVLKNKLISPYINFALMQERLVVNISLLYQNQIFPNERVRDWLGGVLGATWKF